MTDFLRRLRRPSSPPPPREGTPLPSEVASAEAHGGPAGTPEAPGAPEAPEAQDAPTQAMPAAPGGPTGSDVPLASAGSADPGAGTQPEAAPASPTAGAPTADGSTGPLPAGAAETAAPGLSFRERGRLRRRLRFLRRVRELGFRDLGGLVFDQHRFGRRNDALVTGKLSALGAVDAEMRALEAALGDPRSFTELREPGVSACPRCGALHGSEANFCPSCGIALHGARPVGDVAGGPPPPAAPPPSPDASASPVPPWAAPSAGAPGTAGTPAGDAAPPESGDGPDRVPSGHDRQA